MDFTEQELADFRRIFFPLFEKQVTTGYNVYPVKTVTTTPFRVNYLHAQLGVGSNGFVHEHRMQLADELKNSGFSLVERLADFIVTRNTLYLVQQGWVEEDLKLYDGSGLPISPQEAAIVSSPVVGEARQYDLTICVDTEKELIDVAKLMNEKCNKFKLNDDGDVVFIDGNPVENESAVIGSWDVPVVVVSGSGNVRSYSPLKKVHFSKGRSELSTFVDRTYESLKSALSSADLAFETADKLGNKRFVNWINQG